MPFIGNSVKTSTTDGRTFRLLEPLVFLSRENGACVEVPAGFVTDGASTPPAVWAIIPPFGEYFRGAVIHDWLYRETFHPREWCDEVFLEAMRDLGVSEQVRATIYYAVRAFGATAFNHDRAALEARQKK